MITLAQGNQILDKRIYMKMAVGFTAILIMLVALAVLSWKFFHDFSGHLGWVAHTHEVRAQIEALKASIIESESARRGYVITAEDDKLDEFNAARRETLDHLQLLRELTVDNPTQQDQLNLLEPLITSHLDFSARMISIRQSQGFEAAQKFALSNQGVRLMSQIQVLLRQASNEEDRLLIDRLAGVSDSFKSLVVAFSLLLGVAATLLIMLAVIIWHYVNVIMHAHEQLSAAHTQAQMQLRKWETTSGEKHREGIDVIKAFMERFLEAQEILKGNGKHNGATT